MYSLGGTALLRLPSEARLEVGMLGLACLLLGAAVLLFHSSGTYLVHLLLAKYTRSPLVSLFLFPEQTEEWAQKSQGYIVLNHILTRSPRYVL